MKNQIVIDGDVLDICSRLKEVDRSYFVTYNISRKKFEVHSSQQKGGSFCFTIPYDFLDERTVEYARKSSISRKNEIIKEMDKQNEKLQKKQFDDAIDHLKEVLI